MLKPEAQQGQLKQFRFGRRITFSGRIIEREKAPDSLSLSVLPEIDASGGSLLLFGSSINIIVACMGGCLGYDNNPKLISSVHEPLKGQKFQARTVTKPSISEDFWATSTCDMDNSAVQSQGSISSISTLNQTLDASGSGNGNIHSEFVNHGLLLWNQTRQQRVEKKKSVNHTKQLREPRLSWNASYESLLGNNKPFNKPIPLGEMIDFLVDIWEQEGIYD